MQMNWENAKLWEKEANNKKTENEPRWSWDSNFKLDFDGEVLSIQSRFYPPNDVYGGKWDGKLKVLLLGNIIFEKRFTSDTLENLHSDVEDFTTHYISIIKSRLR